MVIKNGRVLSDSFEGFSTEDILVEDGKIKEIGKSCAKADIDADGCFVVPGFVDTHFHGAMGETFVDFNENTYRAVAEFEAKNGTTALVPAISAAPKKKLLGCIVHLTECAKNVKSGLAQIYGFHLEGPFFSEKYKGAHLPENIRNTDPDEFDEYFEKGGKYFKIITLAPELLNADAVIKRAVEAGVCVSIGHTDASYTQVLHAIELGASQGTHLFNAMRPLTHREPGTVGGLLLSAARTELICDFFHVHKDVVKMVYRLKGSDKINMITDSEVGTGLADGNYNVNGRTLTVKDKKTYTEDGTIAGGTSCLLDGVRNLVSIGIPLEEACKTASKNPAEAVGIFDKTGSLTEGKTADILVLDASLELKHVVLRGELLF